MMYILMTMMMSMAMFTLIMNTPITMGLTILLMALVISIMFAMNLSTWMGFLIFLIYISGTLIMFAYFVAMAPNKTMFFPMHMPMMLMTPPVMYLLCKVSCSPMNFNLLNMQTNTFYNMQTIPTLMVLALILLITMIIVVKISSSSKGPLRSFNN